MKKISTKYPLALYSCQKEVKKKRGLRMLMRDEIPWLANADGQNVAVVVAHQDDEAIGFCSVLLRSPNALVVHVTDGAPADTSEWKGCATREAYAALRQREANAALDAIRHTGPRTVLGIPDTTAADHLCQITQRLTEIFQRCRTSVVFTHAYEGGHPDHDAVALAVHTAAGRSDASRIVEAPFYRSARGKTIWQQFEPEDGIDPVVIGLNEDERDAKRRMLNAHRSQSGACSQVSLRRETLRSAPKYDFTQPPNRGILARNYERAGIDASAWTARVNAALGSSM